MKNHPPIIKEHAMRWRPRYPFGQMEVGDSFVVSYDAYNECPSRTQDRITGNAYMFAKKRGQKYTTRMMKDGIRVWRVQ